LRMCLALLAHNKGKWLDKHTLRRFTRFISSKKESFYN
jgi:hypothetical protein